MRQQNIREEATVDKQQWAAKWAKSLEDATKRFLADPTEANALQIAQLSLTIATHTAREADRVARTERRPDVVEPDDKVTAAITNLSAWTRMAAESARRATRTALEVCLAAAESNWQTAHNKAGDLTRETASAHANIVTLIATRDAAEPFVGNWRTTEATTAPAMPFDENVEDAAPRPSAAAFEGIDTADAARIGEALAHYVAKVGWASVDPERAEFERLAETFVPGPDSMYFREKA